MKSKLAKLLEEYHSLKVPQEEQLEKRAKLTDQQKKIEVEVNKIVCLPENIVPFFVPGRLIKIKSEDSDWGWGILVSFSKQRINPKKFLLGDTKAKE